MADQTQEDTVTESASGRGRFVVKGQYVKDLSMENPHAPQSLMVQEDKPKIDVSVDLKVQKLGDELYELSMHIACKALVNQQPLFLVDLVYAGIFHLIDVPPEVIEPILLVDAPFVLFPFARRVISDVTRDAGFAPLMLVPIDFHSLYVQNKGKIKKGK